ncbi:hypothetical protein [Bradyrhizobium sp. sBnM-33]|uniref:hypothetical protein n=1 Tax=Bradyrhizobium sp. sBnM-33 TaxID=2831780 RepID=UPI001BCE2863|nr:hypothetical protein [Bradyrhizobium sp. sBnM-33]WOH48864.1 hypothetical protein RX328_32955 [Bradyrhizobium sp. sBnM-33]
MGVRAQVYSATGGKIGMERVVNSQTAGHQGHPTIAVLPSGEFVIAWEGDGLRAQHFSANGTAIGNELLLTPLSPPLPSNASESYLFGQIVGLPDGNFVAICNDRQVYDIFDDGVFSSSGII